jgi:hypothetical protein
MKPFASILSLLVLLLGTSAVAGECLTDFQAAIEGQTLDEKKAVIESLSGKAIECLYAKSGSEPIDLVFFVDDNHREECAVQAFSGRNSLPIGRSFEKHFFAPTAAAGIFGYNEAPINHLLGTPGLFEILPNDKNRTQITFDYREDFQTILRDTDLQKFRGATYRKIRNNTHSPIFAGLTDILKKIDDDIAVGVSLKNGKTVSTFIIVRKP